MEKGKVAQTRSKESLSRPEQVRGQRILSKEHQSHAGKMLVTKRGRAYMSEIGKRGYASTIALYPNFHLEGGKASWRKQNREMLDQGLLCQPVSGAVELLPPEGLPSSKIEPECLLFAAFPTSTKRQRLRQPNLLYYARVKQSEVLKPGKVEQINILNFSKGQLNITEKEG